MSVDKLRFVSIQGWLFLKKGSLIKIKIKMVTESDACSANTYFFHIPYLKT